MAVHQWEMLLADKEQAVRQYTSLGFHVLLTHGMYEGCCTCGDPFCDAAGKHPLSPTGVYSATNDADWIIGILSTQPYANIAVAMGRESGILDLDLDSPEAIFAAETQGGTQTWSFESGREGGGRHLLFAYPPLRDDLAVRNGVELGKKMDIRSDGGYAVFPPSLHASGKTYQWINAPNMVPLAPVPQWLYDLLVFKSLNPGAAHSSEPEESVVEGGRNDYLFRAGSYLRAKDLTAEEIRLVLLERNQRLCSPPLTELEVEGIVASIVERYAQGDTGRRAEWKTEVEYRVGPLNTLPDRLLTAPLTDSGNAECLVELYSKEFKSCRAIASDVRTSRGIMRWTGHVWVEDLSREFRDRAKWTARARGLMSEQMETKEQRQAMRMHSIASENLGKLEAMCELASTNSALVTNPDIWDADPLKLGVLNGVVDLRTGSFVASDPDDYITQVATVMFDATQRSELWERTINEIFEDQPEVVPYMQRVLGYMLTGLTTEHTMWFWYGNGANGKSTIINIMHALLGSMGAATSFSTFDDRTDNDVGDDLAVLRGKRFVAASEGERSRRIAEAKIKTVVSSDRIRCRFLYGTFFEYKPAWKLVLATNHLPEVKGMDEGIWRRIHMVQFNQKFDAERRDRDLESKLRRELPGIFNWCLEGLKDYLERGGFDAPPSVVRNTANMREENDSIQQWFEERVTRREGESLERGEAFTDYRGWCRDNGEYYLPRPTWLQRLEELGVVFEKSGKRILAAGFEISR